jgi:hypothetical protein
MEGIRRGQNPAGSALDALDAAGGPVAVLPSCSSWFHGINMTPDNQGASGNISFPNPTTSEAHGA